MKKAFAIFLACLSLLLLTACGEKEKPSEKVYRIALENQEISFSQSSVSALWYMPTGDADSVMRVWDISKSEIHDLMFALVSDPENEVCRLKKVDKADVSEYADELRSIFWMPYISVTMTPITGPGEGILSLYMGREQCRLYARYSTLEELSAFESGKTDVSNIYFYYTEAPWLEELFQQYYDGRVFKLSDYDTAT